MKTTIAEFKGTIQGLYERIDFRMNAHADMYNCTKLEVAENIQTNIFDYYIDGGVPEEDIAMMWVCYGPKVNRELADNEVDIQDGFFVSENK